MLVLFEGEDMIAATKIFREYDIRGVVGKDFDAAFARILGRAFAVLAKEHDKSAKLRVGVGRDCRLSGPELHAALIEGLRDGGVDVVDTGMGPTPQLYFSVYHLALNGGIQVTGSHNPSDQNGFKMMIGKTTLSGEWIQSLRKIVEAGVEALPQRGNLESYDAHTEYLKELIERSKSQIGKRKLKVVVDAGNGVGGMIGPELIRTLGCEVIELFTEPDGNFPNHHPDPTVLENIKVLRKTVVDQKADLGIGWDGDADRIGVVDEKGDVIFGDMLLLIYGRQLLKELKSPTIIGDVKCSELLFSDLNAKGAKAVMAKTGHSLIKAKLKELHAELAGEMSGHIFFAHRYFGFDDALHASARLLEILSNTDLPLSALLAGLPKMYSTPEIRMDCPDEVKFLVVEQAVKAFPEYKVNTLDGARITFEKGWGLVRASNTQSALVMRFEAESPELLENYKTLVEERISKIQKAL